MGRYVFVSEKGVTLLELVVVLLIIGLVVGISTPLFFKSLNTVNLRASAREVAAVLRKGRALAIAQKKNQKVTIDVKEGKFWLSDESKVSGEESKKEKVGVMAEGISFLKVEDREGEDATGDEGKQYVFFFYPKGNSNGGTVYIKNSKGQGFTIKVDPLLGKVVIDEFGEGEE